VTSLTLAAAALLVALAGPNAAPSAEEQRLFAEGLKAFEAGDARGAERAWKAGYAVAHDPAFLVRIGEAEEKAGAPAEAAESYRRYLRAAPDASDRADIEQRLARIAPAPPARTRGAPPGESEPVGELGAGPAPTLPTGPRASGGGPAPGAVDSDAARATQDDEDAGWTPTRITAWSATAATVVLLGVAAYFGAQASSKQSDVNRLLIFRDEKTGAPLAYTPKVAQDYETALSDGRRDARVAKLTLLGAAGAAVVATVFFVLDGTRPASGGVALAPAPGRGAIGGWTWTF